MNNRPSGLKMPGSLMLEDEFCDIIMKARTGLGLSVSGLARRSGLSREKLKSLEEPGSLPSEAEVNQIAVALKLHRSRLNRIAAGEWKPAETPSWLGAEEPVRIFRGDIVGYEVKGYLLFNLASKDAVIIDTAYRPDGMLDFAVEQGLQPRAVCLTHGHADHAGGLDRIIQKWEIPVYLGAADRDLTPWIPPEKLLRDPADKEIIRAGNFSLEVILTPGHTPGGICYRVIINGQSLCFAGDTVFAGSIGGSNPRSLFKEHLKSLNNKVLALPHDTVILPGHGPGTTVGEEIANNPFAGEINRNRG